MIWLLICLLIALPLCLIAWLARGLLLWPFETREGDEEWHEN